MRITVKEWLAWPPNDELSPKKPRAKRTYVESKEQQKVIAWWNKLKRINVVPEHYILYSNRNTQKIDKLQAGRMKNEGSIAGIPDLFLAVPTDLSAGLYIEMKKPDQKPKTSRGSGGLSEEQIIIHQHLQKAGYQVTTCYGANEAKNTITHYLFELNGEKESK